MIVLDTTPLGILSNPNPTAAVLDCRRWLGDLVTAGCRIIVPEIADYEIRREYIRTGKSVSIQLLDGLVATHEYVPISTPAMRIAAELWAFARNIGQQTAHNLSLDCDIVLCAQAHALNDPSIIVATANPAHLARFAPATDWQSIAP